MEKVTVEMLAKSKEKREKEAIEVYVNGELLSTRDEVFNSLIDKGSESFVLYNSDKYKESYISKFKIEPK